MTTTARTVQLDRGGYGTARDLGTLAAAAVDYPSARWVAARSSNYAVSKRPSSNVIDRIVVHVTQGSYAGTISWFQNPASQVSSHYVVRSSDGAVTQMVREKDRAWHAGNYNSRSVGIEHEGFVDNASWFTDSMYRASAALTRSIADRYGIPKDRAHIVGHNQVPGATHTDPGPKWDWTRYMQLVNGGGNPNTPQSVCGKGYTLVDSAALGSAGTVYLLYNTANDNNCVATMKNSSLGKATATTAYLEVQGQRRVTHSGNVTHYAARYAATRSTSASNGAARRSFSYNSPFEYCIST
ncbi:N-acetylmuramoyl-L-alanine amidase [Streptosporangium lutulentum]